MRVALQDLRALVHEVERQTPPSADDSTMVHINPRRDGGLWFEISQAEERSAFAAHLVHDGRVEL